MVPHKLTNRLVALVAVLLAVAVALFALLRGG
jgi:hypothetical protein